MRGIPDRFWWAQRFGGALLAVGCLIAAIVLVLDGRDFLQMVGDGFIDPRILHLDAEQAFLQAAICALFAVRGILSIWDSFPARGRVLRRRRAVEGDQEAMRRASITVDRRHAPRLSDGPLELLWRATPFTGRIMTILIAIIVAIFGPLALLFGYLAYCIATNTPPIGSTRLDPVSPLERVGWVAATVVVAAVLAFLVVFVIWYLPWERGRAYGVVADNEGLWYYPKGGRKRFLRWDEVRLLEVSLPKRERGHRAYRLYGRNTLAMWLDLPPSRWVSLGLTKQEFGERHQALLDLIVARTGLLPRTFETKLMDAGSGIEGERVGLADG